MAEKDDSDLVYFDACEDQTLEDEKLVEVIPSSVRELCVPPSFLVNPTDDPERRLQFWRNYALKKLPSQDCVMEEDTSIILLSCLRDDIQGLTRELGFKFVDKKKKKLASSGDLARKPDFWKIKHSKSGQIFVLIRTPLGEGFTMTYAASLLRNELSVKGIFMIKDVKFDDAFGLSKNRFFDQAVSKAYVIVGGTGQVTKDYLEKASKLQQFIHSSALWHGRLYENGTHWKAFTFTAKANKLFKLCFLEWHPTFWGEMAEKLGKAIVSRGAKGIWHYDCKVGSLLQPDANIFCPAQYILDSREGWEELEFENVFGTFSSHYQCGPHASVSSPFREVSKVLMNQLIKKNVNSVDCEAAFFARACRSSGLRPEFAALYYASDYLGRHATDPPQGELGGGITDNLTSLKNAIFACANSAICGKLKCLRPKRLFFIGERNGVSSRVKQALKQFGELSRIEKKFNRQRRFLLRSVALNVEAAYSSLDTISERFNIGADFIEPWFFRCYVALRYDPNLAPGDLDGLGYFVALSTDMFLDRYNWGVWGFVPNCSCNDFEVIFEKLKAVESVLAIWVDEEVKGSGTCNVHLFEVTTAQQHNVLTGSLLARVLCENPLGVRISGKNKSTVQIHCATPSDAKNGLINARSLQNQTLYSRLLKTTITSTCDQVSGGHQCIAGHSEAVKMNGQNRCVACGQVVIEYGVGASRKLMRLTMAH